MVVVGDQVPAFCHQHQPVRVHVAATGVAVPAPMDQPERLARAAGQCHRRQHRGGRRRPCATRRGGDLAGGGQACPQTGRQACLQLHQCRQRGVGEGPGAEVGTERGTPWRADDGAHGEVRSHHPGERIRVTCQPPGWDHDTTVQVVLVLAGDGRTSLRFHQERLAGADERRRQREHWRAVMDRVEDALDARPDQD